MFPASPRCGFFKTRIILHKTLPSCGKQVEEQWQQIPIAYNLGNTRFCSSFPACSVNFVTDVDFIDGWICCVKMFFCQIFSYHGHTLPFQDQSFSLRVLFVLLQDGQSSDLEAMLNIQIEKHFLGAFQGNFCQMGSRHPQQESFK